MVNTCRKKSENLYVSFIFVIVIEKINGFNVYLPKIKL